MTHALVEPSGILLVGGTLADGSLQGAPRTLAWNEIVQVALDEPIRDDQPIFGKDATWELATIDGEVATLQWKHAKTAGLLALLGMELPGFDRARAARVFSDGPGNRFRRSPVEGSRTIVWQRAVVRCPQCRAANLEEAAQNVPFRDETPNTRWERRLSCPRCGAQVPIGSRRFIGQ